jgi:hypothetical protein
LDKTVKKMRAAFLGFMRKICDFSRARILSKPKAQERDETCFSQGRATKHVSEQKTLNLGFKKFKARRARKRHPFDKSGSYEFVFLLNLFQNS